MATPMTAYTPAILDDLTPLAELVADSFNTDPQGSKLWIERTGLEHWRCLKDQQQRLAGGLLRIPMGQWFGGQKVSMTGLAGVAVSTIGRGQRLGQSMIKAALEEMRREGTALSTLYGSTTSFYRRCGYERAGSRLMVEIPLRDLPSRGGSLEVRRLAEEQHAEVEALQAAHVRAHGSLARGPYLWGRVRSPRGQTTHGFGFYRDGALEGYTYLLKTPGNGPQDNRLEATDVVLTTPDAFSSFLGLLAGHRALCSKARWPSAATSPFFLVMPEPWQMEMALEEQWLMRIVSLPEALTERGYPCHLQSELQLQVSDPWFPENSGNWRLVVCSGRATVVERAGDSRDVAGHGYWLKLDIGALASLYTGFLRAEDLALAGRAEGSPESLAAASAIFGGQLPALLDFF